MRVLHILEATEGGTRRHILDLLPALNTRGIACSLVYSAVRNPAFREDAECLNYKNCETHEIAMGHSWQRLGDGKALLVLRAHLKANRYDVIHCHSSNAGLLGRLANASCKGSTPLVYTPHYIAFAAGLPIPQRRAARWFEKILAPKTDAFIAVSKHEIFLFQRARLLRNHNSQVIYNGVDAESFIHHSSLSTHHFVIGCFGRLTRQKNQQLLIRALPRITREIPNVRLRLIGAGEDEKKLRALAMKLHVEQFIEWRGDVRDVQREYLLCDIIAQPSRWEGCSYALLEAAASGRAIVASTAGGNPEVIGDAGILLPSRNSQVWAQNIVDLARDESNRIVLGNAARERALSQFRLETMVEKTIAVYQKVMP